MRTSFVSTVILVFLLSSGCVKVDVLGKRNTGQKQQTVIFALPCTSSCSSANPDPKAPDVAALNNGDNKSDKTSDPALQVDPTQSSPTRSNGIPGVPPKIFHSRPPEVVTKLSDVLIRGDGDAQSCDPDGQKTLPLVPPGQTEHQQPSGSQWCWAATTQMVMQYHGVTGRRQCQLVTDAKETELEQSNVSTCCSLSDPSNEGPDDSSVRVHSLCANLTGWPEDVFTTTSPLFHYSYTVTCASSTSSSCTHTINWMDLVNEICFGRPFIYAVEWTDGQGNPDGSFHVRVVKGYHVLTSTINPGTKEKWVEQWDPMLTYNDVPLSYADFIADPYSIHARDYYPIVP